MLQTIDEKLIAFSVFLNGNIPLGVADVQLPKLSNLSDSFTGAGIAGEINSIMDGHYGPLLLTLTWRTTPTDEAVQLLIPQSHLIEFRSSIQVLDKKDSTYGKVGKKITVRAKNKDLDLGKAQVASAMDGSTEMECTYLKIENEGKKILELDKYNYIFSVNGTDFLATVRSQLGW